MDHIVHHGPLKSGTKMASTKSFKVTRLNIDTEIFDSDLINRKSINFNPFSANSNQVSPHEPETPERTFNGITSKE